MRDKKLIILIVLGLGAVASLIYGIVTPSGNKRAPGAGTASVAKKGELAEKIDLVTKEREAKRSTYSFWGRSPFLPPAKPEAVHEAGGITSLNLGGIVRHGDSYRAFINNIMVNKGSSIGGYKVVDIKHDRVILSDGISTYEVRIGK